MRLTEKYYMITPCGLVEVKGKKIDENYAIIYNHKKMIYNVTHIKSGTALTTDGFNKLKDCIEKSTELIDKANKYLNENPKHYKKITDAYNKYIKNGLFA